MMRNDAWTLVDTPHFDESHRSLARRIIEWHESWSPPATVAARSDYQKIVADLGEMGLLRYVVPEVGAKFDVRAVCLIRESLAFHYGLVDSMFAMQGIGTLAIHQCGSVAQQERYLDGCRNGRRIAAFALTEPGAGSDVASLETTATRDGGDFVLNGAKTLITNAGIADHYIVIARTGDAPGSRGLSAFVVDAETPGLMLEGDIDFIAPHPAGSLRFADCRIPAANLIGVSGSGFKIAMAAFNVFRPSVGAAAVGFARRALQETLKRVSGRKLLGRPMAENASIQMAIADMVADTDTGVLSVYQAAWDYDVRGGQPSYLASLAKLHGTEAAGRVVDRAVQLFGGEGVTRGTVVEQLYREVRPMRIYEGASEIQKLIIGRRVLQDFASCGVSCGRGGRSSA
jgi:acyl-CoA dehydrogenase